MEQQFIDSSISILMPVMEKSMIMAAEYSKKCNRTFVTAMDLKYAMRYCAMKTVGDKIGSHFPEIYEQESESDESDIEEVEETEEDFTRYSGDDELMNSINEAYDNWEGWEPQSPAESMLKDAIDKQN